MPSSCVDAHVCGHMCEHVVYICQTLTISDRLPYKNPISIETIHMSVIYKNRYVFKILLKVFFSPLSLCMCAHAHTRYQVRSEKGAGFPGAGVLSSCETPDLGARSQTQVLKSSNPPELLSHCSTLKCCIKYSWRITFWSLSHLLSVSQLLLEAYFVVFLSMNARLSSSGTTHSHILDFLVQCFPHSGY